MAAKGRALSPKRGWHIGEWLLKGDFFLAIQDFRLGIPGMLLQVFGGYAVIRLLART